MDIKTIGITGGSGLLGPHLINFFLKKNLNLIASYRKKKPFLKKNIKWVKTDLKKMSKTKNISKYFSKVDIMIINAATTKIFNNKKKYLSDINSLGVFCDWCIQLNIPLIQ